MVLDHHNQLLNKLSNRCQDNLNKLARFVSDYFVHIFWLIRINWTIDSQFTLTKIIFIRLEWSDYFEQVINMWVPYDRSWLGIILERLICIGMAFHFWSDWYEYIGMMKLFMVRTSLWFCVMLCIGHRGMVGGLWLNYFYRITHGQICQIVMCEYIGWLWMDYLWPDYYDHDVYGQIVLTHCGEWTVNDQIIWSIPIWSCWADPIIGQSWSDYRVCHWWMGYLWSDRNDLITYDKFVLASLEMVWLFWQYVMIMLLNQSNMIDCLWSDYLDQFGMICSVRLLMTRLLRTSWDDWTIWSKYYDQIIFAHTILTKPW